MVGGSNLAKQKVQLGDDVIDQFDYVFPENGLLGYKNGKLFHQMELKTYLTEDQLKKLINFILRYIADLDIPIKRGTFIEFRTGMLNVSPIGRNCSYEERVEFNKYDQEHKVREKMVEALKLEFGDLKLNFAIGGMISMDIFPIGWDKTYCLKHVVDEAFEEIHFFGDKTFPGGNDHEIFESPLTIGHTVTGPEDTMQQCKKLFS